MATKNLFSLMLNEKTATAPKLKAPGVKVEKPPGTSEFAFLGQGNSMYRRPMENHGNQVSQGVWGRALSSKPKGVKRG